MTFDDVNLLLTVHCVVLLECIMYILVLKNK